MLRPRLPPALRAALGAAALAALVLAGAPGHAADSEPKPNPEDAALAEALFKEARELMRKKDYAAACPKFSESYRLDPALGAQLNLASCHELEGKIATAWGEFSDAASRALRANDKTREKFARKKADALEPRLPRLVLSMDDPPKGLELSRDDATLRAASLGTPLPIDPGPHTIAAVAPGYKRWSESIEPREGQVVRVQIPALELEERPAPEVSGGPTPGPAGPGGPDVAEGGSSGRRMAGVVIGAVGLAGLAAGGVFVGLTASKKSAADDSGGCNNFRCDPEAYDDIETARTFANGANIALAAGGALVVVGGILILTTLGDAPPAEPAAARGTRRPSAISVLPAVGPDGGGVVARLRF